MGDRLWKQEHKLLVQSLVYLFFAAPSFVVNAQGPGTWKVLVENAGVSAMHMATNHLNKVIIFDRTDYGRSQLRLPNGRCRNDPNDLALKTDCWAHSIEYDIASNAVRPLEVLTDTWCSSGAFVANGTLVHTGGYNDGARAIRYFIPCDNNACDWIEEGDMLADRWYATDQVLPDNRIFVIGGRRSFSYEFVPRKTGDGLYALNFLKQTNTPNAENNLYPFVHLSSDGNLFIFANDKSILLNYKTNKVVKTFPDLPGGGRNYPSSGSSVMLPLRYSDNFKKVEVLVCGGSPPGAFQAANGGTFMTALSDCGRMVITDPNPKWTIENMPAPRVMGDMLTLPTGDVLIINGAEQGTAGWNLARKPALSPFLYSPAQGPGKRFVVLSATTIPRMYHSSTNVLPDGRVLVGGSNTNVGYSFTGVMFPTELRLEAYSPYYLASTYNFRRPTITSLSSTVIAYGATFSVSFTTPTAPLNPEINVYAPSFTTHTYSMNQRLLYLAATVKKVGKQYSATVTAPPSSTAAPAGYYMLRVLNNGIPSSAAWVRFA
eukprot:c15746_g1_i1 orf=241-1875(-)